MRLFVAVRPPLDALAHAEAAVAPVRERHPAPRWLPAERWHLTLAFYGEVADTDVDRVVRQVGRGVTGVGALRLSLHGAGQFARRAVWLGLDGDVSALRATAGSVAAGGERRGSRAYRPHLTVARLRGQVDVTGAVAELAAYAGPPWPVQEVYLVRSRLGPSPTYEDVATWLLR